MSIDNVRCLLMLVLLGVLGCSQAPAPPLPAETDVACARCIFEMPGIEGCPWAVEVDGVHYLLYGPVPHDHQSHDPDGICNMRRRARLSGAIKQGNAVASTFELMPAENIPANPRFTPEIIH